MWREARANVTQFQALFQDLPVSSEANLNVSFPAYINFNPRRSNAEEGLKPSSVDDSSHDHLSHDIFIVLTSLKRSCKTAIILDGF
jgi:hypothetical protein